MNLAELQSAIEPHLARIEKILPPEYRLTLVARYCADKYADADIILTRDPVVQKAAEVIIKFAK